MNVLRVSAVVVFLVAGCTGATPATTEPAPAASPTDAATATPTEPVSSPASPSASAAMPTASPAAATAQKVDIGGRSLYIECRGSGSPTILFLHGFAGDRTHGYHLLDGFADRNRVCVYDRASMGLSDPAEGVQSGADVITDLKRLLEQAEVPGPYLLVANSFGGVPAEVFAGDQPDAVAGMVLVDASLHSDADLDRYFADRGEFDLEVLKAEFASGPEPIEWTIHDEARAALSRMPDVPITYLRASQGSDVPADAQEIWEAGLDALLARSSNARVVDVEGPHTLPPPPVHEAINLMLDFLHDGLAPATPSVSPTDSPIGGGPWILYQADFTGRGGVNLGVVRPDGTDSHRLAGGPANRWHPAWSPDGTQIAYDWILPTDVSEIAIMSLDGSDERSLLECVDPCFGNGGPAWSPDGRFIAFDGAEGPTAEHAGDLCYLALLEISSGIVTRFLEHEDCEYGDSYLRFAPDGERVVFQRQGSDGISVFTATITGEDERQLTDWGLGARPDWSPDGEWIVFMSVEPESHPGTAISLDRVRPNGTDLEQLTHPSGTTVDLYPNWLPDGSGILFSRCPEADTAHCETRQIAADGSDDRLVLPPFARHAVHVMWQPSAAP